MLTRAVLRSQEKATTLTKPILCIFAALFPFAAPAVAAICAFGVCIAAMFFAAPWTWLIYRRIRGEVPRDAVIHTTDAGCAALIFLLLFFALFPVLISARKSHREYSPMKKPTPDVRR